MAGGPSRGVWKQLDGLFRFGTSGHLGDDELLGRFVSGRWDEAGEAAFAALVGRYGPMVLGVCRRVLGDRHEAEDAFQATFLVLARKAGTIACREQLAGWLHGVASRTARDARARADRRRAREHKAFAMMPAELVPADDLERGELRAIIDEELARLPASYRAPVILCELDGLSRQVAARRLGIPEGTLSSRLARAKDLLRHRLARRGLAPSVVAMNAVLSHEAQALILSPSLASSTIQAAARVAAGASLAEAVSASVATLTQGVLHTMFLTKIKGMAFGLAAAAVVTTGVGVMAQGQGFGPGPETKPVPGAAQEDRLGAVEKKLDRILEALDSRQSDGAAGQDARAGRAARSGRGGFGGFTTTGPPAAGGSGGAGVGAGGGSGFGMTGPGPMPPRAVMKEMMSRARTSSPIESRVAELEKRFANLERRFEAMERRLSSGGGAAPAILEQTLATGKTVAPLKVPNSNLERRGFTGN